MGKFSSKLFFKEVKGAVPSSSTVEEGNIFAKAIAKLYCGNVIADNR